MLAVRSQMRSGSVAREAAKSAAVPVYAIKSGTPVILERAFETLVGLQLADSSAAKSSTGAVQYQNQVVSRVHLVPCERSKTALTHCSAFVLLAQSGGHTPLLHPQKGSFLSVKQIATFLQRKLQYLVHFLKPWEHGASPCTNTPCSKGLV